MDNETDAQQDNGSNPELNSSKASENAGYGRPPRTKQFKPGQSGNPKGRPKGSKNFATAFKVELDALVPVTENGKRRKIPKRSVIAKQVVNKAAAGDPKAIGIVLGESRFHENAPVTNTSPSEFLHQNDQLVIESMLRRIREGYVIQSVDITNSTAVTDQTPSTSTPSNPEN